MLPDAGNVLDLAARRRIVEHVRASPGLHLRALAEQLQMPVSTLEYHCYQLTRHGHLAVRESGGFKAFYPAEGMDRRDKDILYLVRHDGPRRICAHLLLHPGATPKDLKAAVGLAGPTLSFHLKKMRDAHLLREEAAGRTKRLFVEDPERVASVLVTYRRSFLDEVVDRFASLWLDLHAADAPPAPPSTVPDGPGPMMPAAQAAPRAPLQPPAASAPPESTVPPASPVSPVPSASAASAPSAAAAAAPDAPVTAAAPAPAAANPSATGAHGAAAGAKAERRQGT